MEKVAKFWVVQNDPDIQKDKIKLPHRSTVGSAAYDFYSPISFELKPGENIVIKTGIRCCIDPGWVLLICPRSSMGFKYSVSLVNTLAVIDSDYYYSDNEGHIMIKLHNGGDKSMFVNEGDRFCQGMLVPFGITYDDDADGIRNGGMGSTGI